MSNAWYLESIAADGSHVTHAIRKLPFRIGRDGTVWLGLQFAEGLAKPIGRLAFAAEREVAGMLYTSSGAVYGRQPAAITHVSEDAGIAPVANDAGAAYAHGKRAARHRAEDDLGVDAQRRQVGARAVRCGTPVLPQRLAP